MHLRSLGVIALLTLSPLVWAVSQASEKDGLVVWVSCDGTVVLRTTAWKLEVSQIEKNNPNCLGPKVADDGKFVSTSVSTQVSAQTWITTPSSTGVTTTPSGVISDKKEYTPQSSGPLLDLASSDIVTYRIESMKEKQIRYADVVRSVRMRQEKSKQSKTVAYLMNNDAVVVHGSGAGWTPVQWATVSVTDTRENTVTADTTGKAKGYVGSQFLRNPNTDDLVTLGQADQAYWSDVAHVNVAYLVNVRSHPWYGAPIVAVLGNQTPLYIVSTVDNWSLVKSDDGSIHGYIRSDFLVIDKKQRPHQF
jgi:hypothetical protein